MNYATYNMFSLLSSEVKKQAENEIVNMHTREHAYPRTIYFINSFLNLQNT